MTTDTPGARRVVAGRAAESWRGKLERLSPESESSRTVSGSSPDTMASLIASVPPALTRMKFKNVGEIGFNAKIHSAPF